MSPAAAPVRPSEIASPDIDEVNAAWFPEEEEIAAADDNEPRFTTTPSGNLLLICY